MGRHQHVCTGGGRNLGAHCPQRREVHDERLTKACCSREATRWPGADLSQHRRDLAFVLEL
eukprot:CAMPEP_0180681644 /NCGR_PEP_ID=MMETSP1037_2-20121125/70108_1 /TAXON_ID=632150 /ORGANISM="Azadinium spinosum, Strain 3D9" /LENGTH=60 /DNA_ID=CAMNT_0022711533 /DNA_START=93 /DNA_END=272 /DNA_ORIENTATION=-